MEGVLTRKLKQRAKSAGKSFNQVALDALTAGASLARRTFDDLDFLVGSLSEDDAKHVESELAQQARQVDPKLWKRKRK